MTALSSTVLLIFGMVFLGIVTQEVQAGGLMQYVMPADYKLKQLSGKKCLAVMWNGVCANDTCVTKIKRTLSKKSLLSIASESTETLPYHPFMIPNSSYYQQAVCYYDYGSQSSSCCDQIFSGLKTSAQSTNFGDWDWIKFKLTRYLVSHIRRGSISTESKLFVLPWHDYCVMYKPSCGSKGTCDNELKPRHYNCKCNSGWKGDNCTIVDTSTPMPTTPGYQGGGGAFSIDIPRDYQLKQLLGKKCLAVMWHGVCANDTCVTKIKRTLSRKSLLSIASESTETQPYHPFMLPNTNYYQQAVCYYDYGSQSSSCCDQIFSGLNARAQPTNFGDWDWIKIKLTRYHVNHIRRSSISTESKLVVLPWHDSCVMYKPCGSKGTCDNELKPRHYNCTCNSGWKGDNCTIEDTSTPMPTTLGSQGNSITAVLSIIYVVLAFLSRFLVME